MSTFATRECSTASSQPRGVRGSVRSASVTGAPRARKTGTTIASTMCCTMCTLSSAVSYAASPDCVATAKQPIPAEERHASGPRATGPRARAAVQTPQR